MRNPSPDLEIVYEDDSELIREGKNSQPPADLHARDEAYAAAVGTTVSAQAFGRRGVTLW
jgi:hypothetical protein